MDKRQELLNALQDEDETLDVDETENWEYSSSSHFPPLIRKRSKTHPNEVHTGTKLRRLNLDDALIRVFLFVMCDCSLLVCIQYLKSQK